MRSPPRVVVLPTPPAPTQTQIRLSAEHAVEAHSSALQLVARAARPPRRSSSDASERASSTSGALGRRRPDDRSARARSVPRDRPPARRSIAPRACVRERCRCRAPRAARRRRVRSSLAGVTALTATRSSGSTSSSRSRRCSSSSSLTAASSGRATATIAVARSVVEELVDPPALAGDRAALRRAAKVAAPRAARASGRSPERRRRPGRRGRRLGRAAAVAQAPRACRRSASRAGPAWRRRGSRSACVAPTRSARTRSGRCSSRYSLECLRRYRSGSPTAGGRPDLALLRRSAPNSSASSPRPLTSATIVRAPRRGGKQAERRRNGRSANAAFAERRTAVVARGAERGGGRSSSRCYGSLTASPYPAACGARAALFEADRRSAVRQPLRGRSAPCRSPCAACE